MSAQQILTRRKPRIGILGIMQDLYDDMIPGIAQRQEGYADELAAHLSDVAEFPPSKAIKYREDAETAMREFEDADLDGVLVVMLTYGPAMRVARLLSESRLPICLANIQPEPSGTPAWDMAAMTYNQGVHGDLYRGMAAAGDAAVREVIDFEDAHFEIDSRLSAEEREDHARMQVGIENILVEGGFGAYTAHF